MDIAFIITFFITVAVSAAFAIRIGNKREERYDAYRKLMAEHKDLITARLIFEHKSGSNI